MLAAYVALAVLGDGCFERVATFEDAQPSADATAATDADAGVSSDAGADAHAVDATSQPMVYTEASGALHSLIFDGLNQSTGSVSPWSNYNAFPGLARCQDGTLITVARRALVHGTSFTSSKLVLNRSTNGGRNWLYNRTNEPEIEDNSGLGTEDPYSPALMVRSDGLVILTYEIDFNVGGGAGGRRVFFRTSADCGVTWSARTQFPVVGTSYDSAGGSCVEAPWGAIVCPEYYLNTGGGETDRVSFVYRDDDGIGSGAGFFRSGTMASAPGSIGYQEPMLALLSGDGYCGVATSSSCLCGLMRSRSDQHVHRTYSRDWGNTWDPEQSVFDGDGWNATVQDPSTGIVIALNRGVPTTGAGGGRTQIFTSTDRCRTFSGPSEIAGQDFPTADVNFGSNTSYLYGQCVVLGANRFGCSYGQEGTSVLWGSAARWGYQEVFVGRPPASEEIPYKSTRLWYQLQAGSPVYASGSGSIAAFHGASRLTCAVRYRRDTNLQTERLIQYWGPANNSNNGFYMEISNANQHIEVSIPASSSGFQRIATANNTVAEDIEYAILFTYDGSAVGDSSRLQAGANGTDLTGGASYLGGSIPAAMTSPAAAAWRLGAGPSASSYLRGSMLDQAVCWIGSNAPNSAQYASALAGWAGPVHDPTVFAAAAWAGGPPDIFFPLEGSVQNLGTISVGALTRTGTFTYANDRVLLGAGYGSP